MNFFKRVIRGLARPIWRRVSAPLEARIRALEENLTTIQLQANHVPVLDSKVRTMELQTNHVPVLDSKVKSLEFHAVTQEGFDFRLEEFRKALRGDWASEGYLVRQHLEDKKTEVEGLFRSEIELSRAKEKTTSDLLDALRLDVENIHSRAGATHSHLADIDSRVADIGSRVGERSDTVPPEARSKLVSDWVREEWQWLRPKDVIGKTFKRIGREGDGGYVMIDDFAGCSHVLSFGVGTEISWDLALAELGLTVFLYDHTIESIPIEHPRLKLRRLGLGVVRGDKAPKRTVADILAEEGLQDDGNLILKIDVEGDEFEVLRILGNAELRHFRQIVVEFHGMSNYSDHNKHIDRLYALKRLAETHEVVHIHANNWGRYVIVGGIPVPDVVEVTYARMTYSFTECTRTFPTEFDSANNSDRAELMFQGPLLTASAPAKLR